MYHDYLSGDTMYEKCVYMYHCVYVTTRLEWVCLLLTTSTHGMYYVRT